MPPNLQDQDTIFRNIKLVTTPWSIFVYVINPFISWALMMYTCFHLNTGGILSTRAQLTFAVVIYPVSVLFLAMATGEKIKSRLEERGYEQRRTRAREIDLLLNLAVFGAFYYWLQSYESDGKESRFAVGLMAVFGGLMIWWFIVMMSIGPVLWFTVRVR
ncbi:hypothetical protein M409DRAFT_23493 [Zasmidium cellare ATCC 36951]|uniref:Uncharacterized protein n=1 Tax=Zasmidium cellare ATCC 36951 TaxID=1080233 RepID=A0A6A6CGW7_ZASCE|nr:uncharacterized protein M409DRAFT_23493 [Zasmidium cellare ATCC 36951]KAF2166301.1 hypothetical protein M409DRAFT_23493 [Zasmidium cellare ATCC 36951]